MIYFNKCKLKGFHEPCKKCNALIMFTKDEVIISGRVISWLRVLLFVLAVVLIIAAIKTSI